MDIDQQIAIVKVQVSAQGRCESADELRPLLAPELAACRRLKLSEATVACAHGKSTHSLR